MIKELNLDIFRDGHVKLSKRLINLVGLVPAVVYCELFSKYLYFGSKNRLKCIENYYYFFNTVEDLKLILNISAYKQRDVLNTLIRHDLIKVYYGHGNIRYISINEQFKFEE